MSRQLSTKKATLCPTCKQPFQDNNGLSQHYAWQGGKCTKRPTVYSMLSSGQANNDRILQDYNHQSTLLQRIKDQDRNINAPAKRSRTDNLPHLPSMSALAMDRGSTNASRMYLEQMEDNLFGESTWDPFPDDSTDVLDLEETPIAAKYACALPPPVLYQVHMEHVIRSHRVVDLGLFDDINDVIKQHVDRGVVIKGSKFYKRDQLVNLLTNAYNLHHLRPTIVSVSIKDNSKRASVAVFDVKAQILSILHDKRIMQKENFAKDYDIFSGKPTTSVTHFGEIHTGTAWEPARAMYCGDDEENFPLALCAFYDKTNLDVIGELACAPFLIVPSFLNGKARRLREFTRVLGYIPNLSHGSSSCSTQSAEKNLQDEHNCLRLIMEQIAKIHKEGGIKTMVMGRKVTVKVWLHHVAGDIVGQNDLTGTFNCHGRTNCPINRCWCPYELLDSTNPQCKFFTVQDVETARKSKGGMRSISKYDIVSCFEGVPLANMIYGIYFSVPTEMLHVNGTGLLKYMFIAATDLIGPNESKKKEKEEMDNLHMQLVEDANRQSEKDLPRMSARSGPSNPVKCTGGERVGNFAVYGVAASTTTGMTLLRPGWTKNKISQTDYLQCIKQVLAYHKWVHQHNPIGEVETCQEIVSNTMSLIQHCFPRGEGQGYKLPKVHAFVTMPQNIMKFGCGDNFSGETGERQLKSVVKDLAKTTQRRPEVFAEQLATRMYEENVLNHAYKYSVMPALSMEYERVKRMDDDDVAFRGKYTLTIGATDHHGRGKYTVEWHNPKRDKLSIDVSEVVKIAITKFATKYDWHGQFSITGYTEMKKKFEDLDSPTTFHANELISGKPWYDWAMVQFYEVGHEEEDSVCPAKILGFFQYNDAGMPTPHLVDELQHSPAFIYHNSIKDETQYAVVVTSENYLPWYEIEQDFISPFHLGSLEKCLFIVDVSCIISPLCVFQDYGGTGHNTRRHFAILPYRKWGKFFSDLIEYEGDEDDGRSDHEHSEDSGDDEDSSLLTC